MRRNKAAKDYAAEFASKVRKTRECWYWTGPLNDSGYGMYTYRGQTVRAHRMALIFAGRPPLDSQVVCHSCDNPACVNPDHLFVGTHQDNMADMMAKGRNYQGPSKIPGSLHPSAKLTEQIAREIRASSESVTELTERYGVSRSLIYGIRKGTHWKYA